jgi:hypothetical protein
VINTADYRRTTDNGDHCQDMIYAACDEIDALREQCRRADFDRLAMKGVRDDLVELVKTYACSVRQLGIFGRPKFAVFDEEGEILTEADTVEEAARLAIRFIENRE